MILTLKVIVEAGEIPQFETYLDDAFTAGFRAKISVADLRLSLRPDKQNFGAAVYTAPLLPRLPLTFKAGNLSAGGALSTLNSPELTAGSSPFTTSISATSPLTATLPVYSSFSKPAGAFFEASLPKTLPFALKLNTLQTNQSTTSITSVLLSLPLKKIGLTLSAAYTGGLFTYEKNANSSWFLKSPYYSSGTHYCALFQLSAESKNSTGTKAAPSHPVKSMTLTITGALYESPFGFYQLVYRADSKLTTKHTNFFAQIFYNNDNLLTSSGKTLEPCFQLKSGVLYKSPSRFATLYFKQPVFLRAGINSYLRINLTETEHPVKLNAGFQLSTEKTTQSISFSAEGTLISKSQTTLPQTLAPKSISAQLKSTWKLDSFSPILTANLTLPHNPNSQKKYKIAAGTAFKSKKSTVTINATTTLSGTFPTQEESPQTKLSASLSIHLKIKYITIIGKIGFNEDIEF